MLPLFEDSFWTSLSSAIAACSFEKWLDFPSKLMFIEWEIIWIPPYPTLPLFLRSLLPGWGIDCSPSLFCLLGKFGRLKMWFFNHSFQLIETSSIDRMSTFLYFMITKCTYVNKNAMWILLPDSPHTNRELTCFIHCCFPINLNSSKNMSTWYPFVFERTWRSIYKN